MHRSFFLWLGGTLALSAGAQAQLDAKLVAQALSAQPGKPTGLTPDGAMQVLVRATTAGHTYLRSRGAVKVSPGWLAWSATPSEVLAAPEAIGPAFWSAPFRPTLNMANGWTGSGQFRNLTGVDRKGSRRGDCGHRFRPRAPSAPRQRRQVSSRLDTGFLNAPPLGKHPALEAKFGCNDKPTCAVYSGADLDKMIASNSPNLPRDAVGHGTHVASLAAGNGAAGPDDGFTGVAPEATVISARVTRKGRWHHLRR